MIKIQIKSIWGEVLFEYEKEHNTIKDTLIEAIKKSANLRSADLSGADLSGADLRSAYLSGADLSGANLRSADLSGADLSGAYLSGADLRSADLSGAYLSGAYLSGADLRSAYLSGAYLSGANLRSADLSGADLRSADLSGADLSGAKEVPYVPFACPSDGAFIGWKKVENCLVKLEIPEDARRCSCTSQKCRCDKAKVLEITDLNTNESVSEIKNTSYSPAVTYVVGEMVYPDSFDENRWNECSHGIHFFINKQNAIDY